MLDVPIEENPLNEESSSNLLAENLEKLNVGSKLEEEVKINEVWKVPKRKISDNSGDQVLVNEETFIIRAPVSDILIRLFHLDIYQKNSNFFKFAPIQKLMNALFSNMQFQDVTLISLVSDEQAKQNITIAKVQNYVMELNKKLEETKEMLILINEQSFVFFRHNQFF